MSKKSGLPFSLHKKQIILFSAILFLIALSILVCLYLSATKDRANDYKRITTEEYNTAFLSMFPIDNYNAEDFNYYLAEDIFQSSYSIPNVSTLRSYMKRISSSDNTIATAYLGIRPEKVDADKLVALLREYPTLNYHIILAYPSIDYWKEMSAGKREETLIKYRELTNALLTEANVTVYSFSREWLICNPANYEDVFLTTKEASHNLLVYCNKFANYYITPGNADSVFAEFSALLEQECNSPIVYPDLSEYKIVFIGDSFFGNYTGTTSIPRVVESLTGATVYNCGFGGNTAAHVDDIVISLPEITEAFVTGDTSRLPTDQPVSSGINTYTREASDSSKLCIVINYGLNDYYKGVPVSTDDPYDINSYTGAFRRALDALQEAYPDAQIILTAASYTSYFGHGTQRMSESGGVLSEYVDALTAIAAEYQVDIIDNYSGLPITAENYEYYIPDGTHPNEKVRFTIGSKIALTVR